MSATLRWTTVPAGERVTSYPEKDYLLPHYLFLDMLCQNKLLYWAKKKNKHLIKCIVLCSLLLPELIMATTAALSHLILIVMPFHSLPHTAHATTMGRSSFTVIWTAFHISGHRKWNQLPVEQKAPHPQCPEASEITVASGLVTDLHASIRVPFHSARKRSHHWRSERKPTFKRIWWCNSLTFVDSSIILLRKDLPGGTTRQACCKCPIRDSSSRLVHDFFVRQDRINACRRTNLSWGSLISEYTKSKSIPRNTLSPPLRSFIV